MLSKYIYLCLYYVSAHNQLQFWKIYFKFSIHIPFCNGTAEVRDAKETIIFVPSSIILTFEALMGTFEEAVSVTYNWKWFSLTNQKGYFRIKSLQIYSLKVKQFSYRLLLEYFFNFRTCLLDEWACIIDLINTILHFLM